jgi:hypothetical protein
MRERRRLLIRAVPIGSTKRIPAMYVGGSGTGLGATMWDIRSLLSKKSGAFDVSDGPVAASPSEATPKVGIPLDVVGSVITKVTVRVARVTCDAKRMGTVDAKTTHVRCLFGESVER